MPRATVRRLVVLWAALPLLFALVPAAGAQISDAVTPDDPLWGLQWAPRQVRAEQAWSQATGAGTTIAIVDSGIERVHPDLRDKIVGGVTFAGCPTEPDGCGDGDIDSGRANRHGRIEPGHPHGTHVAGIAAASTGNGEGIAGVAPDADLLAVKSLDQEGAGTFEEVAAGVRWATANGADVINLSLGALPGAQALSILGVEDPLLEAINDAVAQGVVVVAAAGNEYASICAEPSFGSGALCVVATDRLEQRALYSNFGVRRDMSVVAAPGGAAVLSCQEDIVSAVPADRGGVCSDLGGTPGYDFLAGTSMAAPHVAGVAALLLSAGVEPASVVRLLQSTARQPDGGRGTWTPTHGYGIVDAAAALAAAQGEATAEPTEEPSVEPTEEPAPRQCRNPGSNAPACREPRDDAPDDGTSVTVRFG